MTSFASVGETEEIQRVVLIGFSGTGKSTIARTVAGVLDWTAIDTDRAIEIVATKSIPEIFAHDGEAAFRALERDVLLHSLRSRWAVIATGGGAVVPEDLWTAETLRAPGTFTVCLDAEPPTILDRLLRQQAITSETIERPLLAGDDPLGRITALKADRQAAYDRADLTLVTDTMSLDEVSQQIAALIASSDSPDVVLNAPGGRSEIYVRPGISAVVGSLAAEKWPRARKAFIVTDSNVGQLHEESVRTSMEAAGLVVEDITVAPGEASKSWATAGDVIGQMLDKGIQRTDIVVALGGGMIGDLAGFAAAVVLRGVALIQVPTSLLAMVDSSVGGKTGINYATGKNLIGAFYQPALVLADPNLLRTLPPRELNQGWSEVIKHAVIQPSTPDHFRNDLFRFLERNRANLTGLREPAITYAIRRNVALKSSVVEADEREASLRAILNYGHTIGHAIEAAGYEYLHGEAIAVGIRAANRIARLQDRIDDALEKRIGDLLTAYGLPESARFDTELVKAKMKSDKKSAAAVQTWVVPAQAGGVQLVTEVDASHVDQALDFVRSD
jgi:shikimate kinase/3-dehydroquinate synthase